MSGGHWNYDEHKHREAAELFGGWLELLPDLEHDLDWGLSGDSCLLCSYLNVGRAVELLLDGAPDRAREFLRVAPPICPDDAKRDVYNTDDYRKRRAAWWDRWILERLGWTS